MRNEIKEKSHEAAIRLRFTTYVLIKSRRVRRWYEASIAYAACLHQCLTIAETFESTLQWSGYLELSEPNLDGPT